MPSFSDWRTCLNPLCDERETVWQVDGYDDPETGARQYIDDTELDCAFCGARSFLSGETKPTGPTMFRTHDAVLVADLGNEGKLLMLLPIGPLYQSMISAGVGGSGLARGDAWRVAIRIANRIIDGK